MKHIFTSFALLLTIACQEAPAPEKEAAPKSSNSETKVARSSSDNEKSAATSDSSEGVVGPDEAFFAGVYLQEVFELSKDSSPLQAVLEGATRLKDGNNGSVFDFNANFSSKRLDLMCKVLMSAGDADKNGEISSDEWNELQYNPSLLGLPGEAVSHQFQKELFDVLAGDDDVLSGDECKALLVRAGPAIQKKNSDQKEARRDLLDAWEKILANYDADKDGKLNLAEQSALRKDRAQVMKRLGG